MKAGAKVFDLTKKVGGFFNMQSNNYVEGSVQSMPLDHNTFRADYYPTDVER